MVKDVMQLWTDDTFTDFAIRFNEFGFVVTSNSKSLFSKIIDESDCGDKHSHDWRYTLTEWVNFYLCNLSNSCRKAPGAPGSSERRSFKSGRMKSFIQSGLEITNHEDDSLKCRYCNLRYAIPEECEDHIEFWHNLELNNKPNQREMASEIPSNFLK
jgi:hypothetical protein